MDFYLLDYIFTYAVRGKRNFSCLLKKINKVTFLLYTITLQGQITVLIRFVHATIVGQHNSFSTFGIGRKEKKDLFTVNIGGQRENN